ncbi:MAG: HD domain-containing protein [Candidatus Gastranaerophilales bacterium]|nr:HD domain-containing protein [Candidatus Gastranaerophilales bacterium]
MLKSDEFHESYLETFHRVILEANKKDKKHTVLLVDDEPNNLALLKRTLRSKYDILTATNGVEGLKVIEEQGDRISLVISDQKMPAMQGTEMFSEAAQKYPDMIRMLLTGHSDLEILVDSINKCNLFQYIMKPFDPEELMLIVKNGIDVFELSKNKKDMLIDLKELFYTTIKSISNALDAKDAYTHGHSLRVTLYSLILTKHMDDVTDKFLEEIETAGLLHDIGKIGIPDNIICKPGKLSDDEYEIMKSHPGQGKKMLTSIRKLSTVSEWLNTHHERWDGQGYPLGIRGEEIPLSARIIAIADTYDAMTSSRSYRKALSHEVAKAEIERCSGTQFDPELVKLFLKVEGIFKQAQANPEKYYIDYSILRQYFSEDKNLVKDIY